jgi:hypothetical protein
MGRSLARTFEASSERSRPRRCALATPVLPEAIVAGRHTFRLRGDTLAAEGRGAALVLGVVADARGADARTLENARWVKAGFARAGVNLVASLGGMGESRQEIAAVLGALADRRWLLVALPGDRESVDEHAAAIAALRAAGLPVVDGATLRRMTVGTVALAPLPGVALDGYGLVAGPDGCGRGGDEVARVPEAAVLLSHAPPRQASDDATDLAEGDVHVGDPWVAQAAERAKARLVVHGLIDERAGRVAGGEGRQVAASGALDGAAGAGSALVVVLDGGTPRVRALTRPR